MSKLEDDIKAKVDTAKKLALDDVNAVRGWWATHWKWVAIAIAFAVVAAIGWEVGRA